MSVEPRRFACEGMLWFILFFAPAAFGSTEWWSRAVLESLIFILATMCALRRDFPAPLSVQYIGFGVIIGLGGIQLLQECPLAGPAGLLPATISRPQTLYSLLLWVALAALLWSASGILRWEGALRRMAWIIFISGLFVAVVGILQRGEGNIAYYGLRPIRQGRPFGPFTNYNHAAAWVGAATLVGAGLLGEGFQLFGRVSLSERIAKQIFIVFVLGISITAVITIGSRGGLNSLCAAALATLLLFSRSLTKSWTFHILRGCLILACSAYAIFLYYHPQAMGFVPGGLEQSAATRISMYRSSLRLLADNPLFGVGLGNFANAFLPYQETTLLGVVDHVHSSWLEIALETGLLGLMAFGLSVLKPLAAGARNLTMKESPNQALSGGYFAAVLAFALHGFVEFNFQIPANSVLFVVLLAAVSGQLRGFSELPESGGGQPSRSILVAAFIVLTLISLPPGFSAAGPRFGPPFSFATETLLPSDNR